MTKHLNISAEFPKLSTFHGRKRLVGILADPGDLCEDCIQAVFMLLHEAVPNADLN